MARPRPASFEKVKTVAENRRARYDYYIEDTYEAGIALTGTLNLPLRYIENAGMKVHADGTGDFPLAIAKPERVAWMLAWPNVRPWRLTHPEPMLRAVPNPERVVAALAEALGGQVPRAASKMAQERPSSSPGMTAPTAAMPSLNMPS